MPTLFGETYPYDLLRSTAQQNSTRLPHDSDPHQIELQRIEQIYPRPQSIEVDRPASETVPKREEASESLQIFKTKVKTRPSPIIITDLPDRQSQASSSISNLEQDIEESQMGRKSRKSPSQEPDRPESLASGGQNGHVNAEMESHMRRKHLSLDSPTTASQTAHLMGRESFSLNEEPLLSPRTPTSNTGFFELPAQDRRNFLLLVLLYFLQGIPMGLAAGSVPILLKKHLSYGQIGVFSLVQYPYSLKLLWSPIVDAVWSPTLGRRKSWILPMQLCSGFGMIYLGGKIKEMMIAAGANNGSGIWNFTWWWFFLVFLCATQDIAVDGWALTLLSTPNLSYASTAQTVGLTAGQFLSYTVFLAFNSDAFSNKFRATPSSEGFMTLGGYLTFWGWGYLVVTLGLALLKQEEKTKERDGILGVYRSMVGILKLKNIQTMIIIHLIAKIGFQANDAVTNLKLLEKGFSQEDLSLTILIDFPFEIGLGYFAGRWSTIYPPIHVWCWAFIARLLASVVAQITVIIFPQGGVQTWYLLTVIGSHIFSTFAGTVMFVAISAFNAKIADPVIGGTYMTLLATFSNLGGTFPKIIVLRLVDYFTIATCIPPKKPPADLAGHLITSSFSCVIEAEKKRCLAGGGKCDISRDGYYITNVICVILGVITFWGYIRAAAMKLQALPLRAWRLEADETR